MSGFVCVHSVFSLTNDPTGGGRLSRRQVTYCAARPGDGSQSGISPCLLKPDTESTEDLSDLRVGALLTLEDMQILLARGESFGACEKGGN